MLFEKNRFHNNTYIKKSGHIIVLSVLWAILSLANSFLSIREMSLFEKIYFSFANSYVFFSGMGISIIILLSSRYMILLTEGNNIIRVLKRWFYLCTCIFGIAVCLIVVFAITHQEMANQWSSSAVEMSFTNSDPIVEVPLLPLIKELMNAFTPIQASLWQMALFYLCMVLYGLVFLFIFMLTKNKFISTILIFIFHTIGQYTINAWPYWAAVIPHSYFFLQYYGPWNPFPLFDTYTAIFRILSIFFSIIGTIIIFNRISAVKRL